jgi:hypothetical protein
MAGGRPALSAEGRPLRLLPLIGLETGQLASALAELSRVAAMVQGGGGRIEIASYDGRPVIGEEVEGLLKAAGFIRGPQTMIRWLGPAAPVSG